MLRNVKYHYLFKSISSRLISVPSLSLVGNSSASTFIAKAYSILATIRLHSNSFLFFTQASASKSLPPGVSDVVLLLAKSICCAIWA